MTSSDKRDTDLSDPAREEVAESGDAFSDTIGSAGGIIGSANVEAAQSLDDAEYNREHGTHAGENPVEEAPGMADYRADTDFGADTGIVRPGNEGGESQ